MLTTNSNLQQQQMPSNQLGAQSAPTLVRDAIARMQQKSGDLSKSVIDLREIADRLLGGEPQDAAKSGPNPVPAGDAQALHAEIDSHEKILAALAYQINRLRSV